jgi:hypothetical protein
MKDIEDYRAKVIADLKKSKTFQKAWPVWEPLINSHTANLSDPHKVLSLGDELASIFRSTSSAGRGQGVLSAAGSAWEALVCWYLNAVLCGSRGIAIKQKRAFVPECISDAATINYGNDQTNTESDLLVLVFPKGFIFPSTGGLAQLSQDISTRLNDFELGIIQCKTNWNDNAQIPMLWDMVYRATGFKAHNLKIGRKGHSIQDMKNFYYAFVTVPSQKGTYKSGAMAVKRVRNLSGGNYWGKPTASGIALGASEICGQNFKSAFDQPILQSIRDAISSGGGRLPI